MSPSPSISVVIAAYNAADTIADTVASIRRQEGGCEIVVVDDGSSDATGEVLDRLADHPTAPLRWVRQDNAGPGPARNRGLELAAADCVVFVDADDDLTDAAFAAFRRAARAKPDAGLWFGGYDEVYPGGRTRTYLPDTADRSPEARFRDILFHRPVHPTIGTALIRREVATAARFPAIRFGEDLVYYARVLALAPAAAFDTVTRIYRVSPERAIRRAVDSPETWEAMVSALFDDSDLAPRFLAYRGRFEAKILLSRFRSLYLDGQAAEAAAMYRAAVAASASQALRWTYLRKYLKLKAGLGKAARPR